MNELLFYRDGVLHNQRTLDAAQHTYKANRSRKRVFPVVVNNDHEGAVGCIMIHRGENKPLAGRYPHKAQLSTDHPPRLYATPNAAAMAILTLGMELKEFQVWYVHKETAS